MRVHLTGTRQFGVAVLEALLGEHEVVGVTAPMDDRLWGRAERAGVLPYSFITPELMRAERAEVIVAAHSHAFVGRRTRAAVDHAIGYHPSLLPLHRGRDAVRWTIRDRDRVSGGSVYHLTDSVDGGPLAAQDYAFVRPSDSPRSLWERELAPMGVRLLLAALGDLERGRVVAVPQDETLATWEPAMDSPPLHRPELIELPGPRPRFEYAGSRNDLARGA